MNFQKLRYIRPSESDICIVTPLKVKERLTNGVGFAKKVRNHRIHVQYQTALWYNSLSKFPINMQG